MCLLDVEKYEDGWPQIGEILSLTEDKIMIKWYKGSIGSKIVPWVLLKKGIHVGRINWEEEVDKEDIWLSGFHLTKKMYLPTQIKKAVGDYEKRNI